ncbi:MAG: GNAT family N-acetyltransferase, partial [Gammaproteobacteria bacterium]|nr:GNAT family N-acetyltransferase [Gammaproteobacteria bacterium]
QEEEWDGKDDDSWHWLATDSSDIPIGTCRLLPDGQVGRMAVLSSHRGHGIGAALLEAAVEKARHLGMPEVYLHAQTHALGFYEKLGFTPDGEEFMEAGIPHYHMIQKLSPPADNIQRKANVDSDLAMAVKPFDTLEVGWAEAESSIRRIRRQVFVTELGLPEVLETDEADPDCIHWLAENQDGHPVAAIRMTADGEISRVAVLTDDRQHGVGLSLLELTVQRAKRLGLDQVHLAAIETAVPFYTKAGFETVGDPFEEAGVTHQSMRLELDQEDDDLMERDAHGESLDSDVIYKLGVDKQLVLLRGESDFRNVILDMTRQARKSIRIYSPLLSHDLFDNAEFMQICSALARRNKYTRVEILVFDAHRVVKNGHALLNISRKLPSSIGIRIVDPEMRQLNHEYVLVDNEGVIYRQEYDQFEGTACFRNVTECNRLGRQFTASWESGLLDPNLRQLRV